MSCRKVRLVHVNAGVSVEIFQILFLVLINVKLYSGRTASIYPLTNTNKILLHSVNLSEIEMLKLHEGLL